eukprot:COSAG01_NODE_5484_length_4230_cov_12.160252_1_plen_100_part_10
MPDALRYPLLTSVVTASRPAQVSVKEHIRFQIALNDMMKTELDGLKKRWVERSKTRTHCVVLASLRVVSVTMPVCLPQGPNTGKERKESASECLRESSQG